MLSSPLPKHEATHMAATRRVASKDTELGKHLKSWFNMESYTTRVDLNGRANEHKRALEQLEKTEMLLMTFGILFTRATVPSDWAFSVPLLL